MMFVKTTLISKQIKILQLYNYLEIILLLMEENKGKILKVDINKNKQLNMNANAKSSDQQLNKRNLTLPSELIQKDIILNEEEITLEVMTG